MVVMDLQPFSFCEKKYISKHIRVPAIRVNTLNKYMALLTTNIEEKISKILPNKQALEFYG